MSSDLQAFFDFIPDQPEAIAPRRLRFTEISDLEVFCNDDTNNPIDKILALDYYNNQVIFVNGTVLDRIIWHFLSYGPMRGLMSYNDVVKNKTLDVYEIFAQFSKITLERYVKTYLTMVPRYDWKFENVIKEDLVDCSSISKNISKNTQWQP